MRLDSLFQPELPQFQRLQFALATILFLNKVVIR